MGFKMRKKPIIIGVTGGSGGGKTSVSRAILDSFPNARIAMIQHDSYYRDQAHLSFEERIKTNYDHPLAFETDFMIEQLKELLAGRSVDIPIYDYTQKILEVIKHFVRTPKMLSSLKVFWFLKMKDFVT